MFSVYTEFMKKIIHFDMDYFFAQVEERDNPKLKTLPVGVGGGKRGVLCTANYIAREYGVRSAMPTFMALKLCPKLILVRPHSSKYREASEAIFDIFSQYTDKVQGLSLDEAYLDVTESEKCMNSATLMAKEIKDKIYKETKLTGSAGISYNKLLAKIGSDLNKPNGLSLITADNIETKLSRFPVTKINGVGKVTAQKMKNLGIVTFGDLQRMSMSQLVQRFGSYGPTLFNYARGIDNREVVVEYERKSVSVEDTFFEDISERDVLLARLNQCFDRMYMRLEKYNHRDIKSVFVKIKYGDFKQTTIETKGNDIKREAFERLFDERFSERPDPIRLLGCGVRFYPTGDFNKQLSFL
jgi:DNA polymerase-4